MRRALEEKMEKARKISRDTKYEKQKKTRLIVDKERVMSSYL